LGILAATLFIAAESQLFAKELPLSNEIEVSFDDYGAITEVKSPGGLLLGGLGIAGKTEEGQAVTQGWNRSDDKKADVTRSATGVESVGTLAAPDGTPLAEFHVFSKKLAENKLQIRAEITYSSTAHWMEFLCLVIRFPLPDYQGGSLNLEMNDGTERSYDIGESPLTMGVYGARKATMRAENRSVEIDASENSQLRAMDARTYEKEFLRVDVMPDRKWSKPGYDIEKDEKDVFEATITFKTKP
jgi:hypothetical protein